MDRFCGYLWRAAPYVHINPMFISFERVQTSLNKYQIQGGKPLHGTITISGAKNAAVAIIPAALLVVVSGWISFSIFHATIRWKLFWLLA